MLKKPESGPIRLFVCGPTVYNELHIGNARVYIVFDVFARYLRSTGAALRYVQNITDIDDKIIARAKEEDMSPKRLAEKYTRIFKEDMRSLNINSVDTYASATEYIPEIIAQVERLIEKKHAYKITGDGYYFDLATFPHYGKLAHRTIEQAEDGTSRIDENPNKRNKGDFCVWKFSREGEPSWQAPFGIGRPGWHIEDTAISEKHFGPQYEIHGGGIDLKFPHHEAEIAQQESASGKRPFVQLWMHTGLLTVRGKKMSKSGGNFITIRQFLNDHSANSLRLTVLQNHYRSSVDYTEESALGAETAWRSFIQHIEKLRMQSRFSSTGTALFPLQTYDERFTSAMEDDLNTPEAIATLFSAMHDMQAGLWRISPKSAGEARRWFMRKLTLLGFTRLKHPVSIFARILAWRRELFRRRKHFIQSDILRAHVERLGYTIEDTPRGPLILPQRLQ